METAAATILIASVGPLLVVSSMVSIVTDYLRTRPRHDAAPQSPSRTARHRVSAWTKASTICAIAMLSVSILVYAVPSLSPALGSSNEAPEENERHAVPRTITADESAWQNAVRSTRGADGLLRERLRILEDTGSLDRDSDDPVDEFFVTLHDIFSGILSHVTDADSHLQELGELSGYRMESSDN